MRTRPRPRPQHTLRLAPLTSRCPECGHPLWNAYDTRRTVTTLEGLVRLVLRVRRCPNPSCPRFHQPYRPETEPHYALPHHEFGLDVIALVGQLRYAEHRSIPEIHAELRRRRVVIAERTVTNLLDRYDELRALASANPKRLRRVLRPQGRVVLAIDGLQPHFEHEILWVLRDCLSGEVLLARSLLSATIKDLAALIREVRQILPVPITAVVSDGQETIRKAVARTLPGVPHQLCHFHYLREAARPIAEADRHAKKELKKRVRGVRPLERAASAADDLQAEIVRGYCAAVRASLTEEGLPPLSAAGLKLQARLTWIVASLDRVRDRTGGLPKPLARLREVVQKGLRETAALWPPVQAAYRWVHRVARLLENKKQLPAAQMRRGLSQILTRMRRAARQTEDEAVRGQLEHFVKVTKSYWAGLFRCYESIDIPRTNNDLEHLFGSYRYHERRASGRKRPSAGSVVKGAARVVAGLATRDHPEEGLALPEGYVGAWQRSRAELERHREARRQQGRFRRDPFGYLQQLEELLLQQRLPF
jgi:Transposase, Mutator family